jgi:porin
MSISPAGLRLSLWASFTTATWLGLGGEGRAQAAPPAGLAGLLAKHARIDRLQPQGRTTNPPGTLDSLSRDLGGWRSALADRGVFVRGQAINLATLNLLDNAEPARPQRYNGQQTTFGGSVTAALSATFLDTGRDRAQVNLAVYSYYNTFPGVGPRTPAQFGAFEYYQSFSEGTWEIQGGINTNILNYVGIFAGGNPLLASGFGGVIPVQVGMSAPPSAAPAFNLTWNRGHGYLRAGVQRSLLPRDGFAREVEDNTFGLRLTRPGAGALYLAEAGYRRPAAPGRPQTWVRAGAMANRSDFVRYADGRTGNNQAFYFLADRQLTQPDRNRAFRGLYGGLTAMAAPEAVNVYTRTLEARLYAYGLFAGRAGDLMNLTVSENRFGAPARRAVAGLTRLPTQRRQPAVSFLYAARLSPGVYLAPSVTWLRHPSFIGDFKDALNGTLTLSLFF